MMTSEHQEQLCQFLFEHVDTHEQLQTLLWLHKRQADPHTPETISGALNTPVALVHSALRWLCSHQLAQEDDAGTFRYAPETDVLRLRVDQLVQAYDEDWSTILQLLSSNAIRRIRMSVIGSFSDAFLLKGKKS